MKGPIRLIRSEKIEDCENRGPIYEWQEGNAYLMIDKVTFRGKTGALLCYCNPPVHQVGNPGLDAYLESLEKVFDNRGDLDFLILCGANDPVHAGGDLKESLNRLDHTLEMKKVKEAAGASTEEIDRLSLPPVGEGHVSEVRRRSRSWRITWWVIPEAACVSVKP